MIKWVTVFVFFAVAVGCDSKHCFQGSRNGEAFNLFVMQIDGESNDGRSLSFKVRFEIPPAKRSMIRAELNDRLIYGMDTCFKVVTAKRQTSASLVQPVTSGAKNSYEYLVMFELPEPLTSDSLLMQIDDKYIENKTHWINLIR